MSYKKPEGLKILDEVYKDNTTYWAKVEEYKKTEEYAIRCKYMAIRRAEVLRRELAYAAKKYCEHCGAPVDEDGDYIEDEDYDG